MKLLIIFIALSIASFSAFSADVVGEDKKGECEFANQSSKREAKVVAPVEAEIKKEAAKNTSK